MDSEALEDADAAAAPDETPAVETEADPDEDETTEPDLEITVTVDSESEAEPGAEVEPELSEWSPVGSARRNRAATAKAKTAEDASWWDAALSSGDADNDAE